jgi:hypothetical protein
MSNTNHPRIPNTHRALTKARRFDLDYPGEMRKPEPEPMAEWERILLAEPDVTVLPPECDDPWTDLDVEEFFDLPEYDLDDDDDTDDGYTGDWMPLVTIEQARDIFCGRDFIIDHTNVQRTR